AATRRQTAALVLPDRLRKAEPSDWVKAGEPPSAKQRMPFSVPPSCRLGPESPLRQYEKFPVWFAGRFLGYAKCPVARGRIANNRKQTCCRSTAETIPAPVRDGRAGKCHRESALRPRDRYRSDNRRENLESDDRRGKVGFRASGLFGDSS